MRILHTSDLHGGYKKLWRETDFDIWIDTGDFFTNAFNWGAESLSPSHEVIHQCLWWERKSLGPRIKEWLNGRPAICVSGNHDFVDICYLLQDAGVDVHNPTQMGGCTVDGIKYAGFAEIPYINGNWSGETHELQPFVDKAMNADPEILLTHAPPAGILDEQAGYGINALTAALMYRGHNIHSHLFGHTHRNGGEQEVHMDIKFYNGARHALIHEI
jgi:Icc-related predicted phosphoesterase